MQDLSLACFRQSEHNPGASGIPVLDKALFRSKFIYQLVVQICAHRLHGSTQAYGALRRKRFRQNILNDCGFPRRCIQVSRKFNRGTGTITLDIHPSSRKVASSLLNPIFLAGKQRRIAPNSSTTTNRTQSRRPILARFFFSPSFKKSLLIRFIVCL